MPLQQHLAATLPALAVVLLLLSHCCKVHCLPMQEVPLLW